jgi:hypothetical protein
VAQQPFSWDHAQSGAVVRIAVRFSGGSREISQKPGIFRDFPLQDQPSPSSLKRYRTAKIWHRADAARLKFESRASSPRHGRGCPGHPRLGNAKKDVDARHRRQVYAVCARQTATAGHDELEVHGARRFLSPTPRPARAAGRSRCAGNAPAVCGRWQPPGRRVRRSGGPSFRNCR